MKALILVVISLFLFAGAYADTATGSVIVSGTPNITINNPTANGWYNASFTINASISGAPITATYRWENSSTNGAYTSLTYQGSGVWTKAFGITSVADGNYTFRINSSDAASHTDNDTVFIYVDDTEPIISSFTLTRTEAIHCDDTLRASDFSCAATDNSESFGGSVTEVITGIDTSSSGTKTATCTVTDSASNTDTATAQYTVGSCGVSGGGGNSDINESATNITQQETAIITAPESVTEVTITPSNLEDITSVVLRLSGGLTAATVDVSTFTEPPAGAGSTGKAVYKYIEITTDAPAGAIKGAKIQFKVEKSWLEQQQTTPDSVILMHYKDGRWQELSTARTSEDANFYYYEAQTDSLSLFAIAIRSSTIKNAITGSAISVPTKPLSTDTMVLGLMALVLIATIVIARMRSAKRKFKRR